MEKDALCKAEFNEIKINQLITEIIQLRFRIEQLQQEKNIDFQHLHRENARLRVEVSQLRRFATEGLRGASPESDVLRKDINSLPSRESIQEDGRQKQKTIVERILRRSEASTQTNNEAKI